MARAVVAPRAGATPVSALAPYTGVSLTTFSHARHALVEALRRSGISPGGSVLVPGFVCRDVLASLHSVGARAVFYEVDADLRPVGLDDAEPTHAALAVDYFGIAQDMAPFERLRERHGTIVIEDNAHGMFSRDPSGRLLGTRGDFGLLSMRKTFHLPNGAALLDSRTDAPAGRTDCVDGGGYLARDRISRLERATGVPVMASARSGIRLLRSALGRSPIPTGDIRDELVLPTGLAISCAALRRLRRIDPNREIDRRHSLFVAIGAILSTRSDIDLLAGLFADGSVPYGLPFRAGADVAELIARTVRRYHVTVMRWPDLPSAIADDAPSHYRDLWIVNFI